MPVIVSACPRRVIVGTAFLETRDSSETFPDIARASQRFAISPIPPVNTEVASAPNATAVTGNPSYADITGTRPLTRMSHSFHVRSSDPETTAWSPARRDTSHALTNPLWPFMVLVCWPVAASHRRSVASGEHVTRSSPSAVQRRSRMAFLCPRHIMKFFREWMNGWVGAGSRV